MSELEEKLNSILSSPKEMEKIMNMARSLSGAAEKSGENEPKQHPQPQPQLGLGNMDPKMIGVMMRIFKEYNTSESDKTALLSAMKPYVKEKNRDALDKAGNILKMAKVAKIALGEFGGGEK